MAKWDYNRRCLSGVSIYTSWVAAFVLFAKSEFMKLGIPEKTHSYIPAYQDYPDGRHPVYERFYRSDKEREEEPTYYYISE